MDKKQDADGFDKISMQANFSALLYVVSEQQALIGKILEHMVATGDVDAVQLNRITEAAGDEEVLASVYADVYKRFAVYFWQTKAVLEKTGRTIKKLLEEQERNEK